MRLGEHVAYRPPDGLSVYRETGTLPKLPEATMPLARIAEEESPPVKLPTADPLELRALMWKLAGGEELRRSDYEHFAIVMVKISPSIGYGVTTEIGIDRPQHWSTLPQAVQSSWKPSAGDALTEATLQIAMGAHELIPMHARSR